MTTDVVKRTAIAADVRTHAEAESHERRARRLFDEMARNIGREAVNHIKTMYPRMLSDEAFRSKIWETSTVNTIRNDINWRMRPLLMALIAMHQEWEDETSESPVSSGGQRAGVSTGAGAAPARDVGETE